MIELANQLADSVERCREYVRFCVVAAAVSDALTFLAAVEEDAVPLDGLYEALAATWVPHVNALREHRDVAIDVVSRAAKYAEACGEVHNGKVTRGGLLLMASHIDAIRSFLNCAI